MLSILAYLSSIISTILGLIAIRGKTTEETEVIRDKQPVKVEVLTNKGKITIGLLAVTLTVSIIAQYLKDEEDRKNEAKRSGLLSAQIDLSSRTLSATNEAISQIMESRTPITEVSGGIECETMIPESAFGNPKTIAKLMGGRVHEVRNGILTVAFDDAQFEAFRTDWALRLQFCTGARIAVNYPRYAYYIIKVGELGPEHGAHSGMSLESLKGESLHYAFHGKPEIGLKMSTVWFDCRLFSLLGVLKKADDLGTITFEKGYHQKNPTVFDLE